MHDILEGYASAATPEMVAEYEALPPERIYEHVADLFPSHGARVADIGAGTGRDAAWLAAKGHEVLAVEPVRELREAGRALHRSERIMWLDDRLPHLALARSHGCFDLVILCAVWQHLTDAERPQALASVAAMTGPGGILVMSLRQGSGHADRTAFPIDADATISAARDLGLKLVRRRESESVHAGNRALGVRWTWVAFEKAQ
jgi:2-polyprenyl-3-methyl-5-hydroxy-6-metoxy-1,4-benzoquinol methylase